MAQGATVSATQQVITIDDISDENAPAIYVAGGLGRFVDAVKTQVVGEVPDLTTRKGRERIASLAATVSKSKTAVEKPGRDYLRRLKEMPKVVEAELREFVAEMDALRDQVRQPLTDWQAAEDARVDRHNDAIARIKDVNTEGMTASLIGAMIQDLDSTEIGEEWEEFEEEAHRAKASSLTMLRTALAKQEQIEAEQAELAWLRAEAEARAKADHEAAIAREAVERAQREAEKKAQAERDAAAKREQDLKDQAAAQERAAENQRLQLKLQTEQAERAAEQAEASRVAAEQRAEQQRIDALARQERAVEQARLDELARQQAAAAELVRQEKLREADKAHKATINRAALAAFIAGGMPEACAKQAVMLIAQRKIPSVSISY
jgi:hypothetical protein